MKGGKEVHGTLILLGFLDPTHYSPMVLLTVELGVFPRAWEGGRKRKRMKDRNLEIASFVLI